MLFYCVEPAHDNVTAKKDYFDWTYAIKRGLGHQVAFPHVDSCLGVICKLVDDSVFTGHINGFFNGDYSAASHGAAFDAMLARMDGRAVAKAVVFGDIPNWREYINFQHKLGCQHISFMMATQARYPNGVDVLLNIDSGNVRLTKYQERRDFKTGLSVGNDVNLNDVNGIRDVPCD